MENKAWLRFIPWFLTIACTVSLILVSIYLYTNLEWFKHSALDNQDLLKDGNYRIFLYNTHLSMLKRSLGIITGIAITFLGLGVSFYEMNKSTDADIKGIGKISTAAPGLLAIILGCFLISQSISSKDSIKFDPADNTETETHGKK